MIEAEAEQQRKQGDWLFTRLDGGIWEALVHVYEQFHVQERGAGNIALGMDMHGQSRHPVAHTVD